jgi:hypothetical protein
MIYFQIIIRVIYVKQNYFVGWNMILYVKRRIVYKNLSFLTSTEESLSS